MRFFAFVSLLIFASVATAEDLVNCYEFQRESAHAESELTLHSQIWCYKNLHDSSGGLYVYNADRDEVRPELAMVVEADGFLLHGSLLNGDLTVHRVRAEAYSPFAVPTSEPAYVTYEGWERKPFSESAKKVLDYLRSTPPQQSALGLYNFNSNDNTEFASTRRKPWRGFWWPYKDGPLWNGFNSPLAKYDRLSRARGQSSNAAGWERSNHGYRGVGWEGHCNGWAASSILRREPSAAKSVGGILFQVSDQKALLAITDYCARAAFFGKRYRSGGTRSDIFPALFHKTLQYYIRDLGKPVAMDHRSDGVVDNHVISGYAMRMTQLRANYYDVETTLTVHKYDKSISEVPGIAPTYRKVYRYTLTTDQSGTPTGGYWKTDNPDFFWVPLSSGSCTTHPDVRHELVQQILNGR